MIQEDPVPMRSITCPCLPSSSCPYKLPTVPPNMPCWHCKTPPRRKRLHLGSGSTRWARAFAGARAFVSACFGHVLFFFLFLLNAGQSPKPTNLIQFVYIYGNHCWGLLIGYYWLTVHHAKPHWLLLGAFHPGKMIPTGCEMRWHHQGVFLYE